MCNSKPKIDKSDEVMRSHIIDFPFESSFVSPHDLITYSEDDVGKTVDVFWEEYRCAVIQYLLNSRKRQETK
jgi:hypothetical protein